MIWSNNEKEEDWNSNPPICTSPMMIIVMMLKIMWMIMKGGLIKMITTIMCHVRRPNETLQVWNIIMNRGEWSKWWQLLCSRFEGLMVGTHPPLCTSPMIEINGTRAPHPAASQADAYLFQVGDNGDGDGDGDMMIMMVIVTQCFFCHRLNLEEQCNIAR